MCFKICVGCVTQNNTEESLFYYLRKLINYTLTLPLYLFARKMIYIWVQKLKCDKYIYQPVVGRSDLSRKASLFSIP